MAIVLCLTVLYLGPIPQNQSNTQHAHVHGLAEMTLAIEGTKIELNLVSPAINLVGFEHTANTPAEKRSVEKARNLLESPQQLFSFPEATCELITQSVDLSSMSGGHKHDHHADNSHGSHASHQDISAHYSFRCDKGQKPEEIVINLFDHFPHLERVKVMWITDLRQGSVELTPHSRNVTLRH